jgi:hypothetical protein
LLVKYLLPCWRVDGCSAVGINTIQRVVEIEAVEVDPAFLLDGISG